MSCKRPNTPRSDPKDIGQLREPLRSRIYTATIDAPRRKLVPISLYRDPGRQWDLRHDRCPGRECDKGCKGYPVTAVPAQFIDGEWVGGSRHQHGEAADMGGADLDWLIEHRHEYGLVLTVPSEKWHFETGRRDVRSGRVNPQPTRRIIPWPGTTAPPTIEGLFMTLTAAQEQEIHAAVRETRDAARLLLANTPKKAFAMRGRDGRVWVISDAGRWWVRNMDALSLLIWTGQVAGFGPEGIPMASEGQLNGIAEIDEPTDVQRLAAALAIEAQGAALAAETPAAEAADVA